jgi:uncharacterized protein (TIGR02722 family)
MTALKLVATATLAGLLTLTGCNNEWKIDRVDPSKQTDVDYHFNDQDAREVFHELAQDSLSREWIENWRSSHAGERPIVYLASVKNNTQEYINTDLFTNQLIEEFINSQKVRVKTPRDARQELRDERLDTKYNDPATIKQVAKELNADFALMGSISDVKQRSQSGRTVVNYYQVSMDLVNIETQEVVWRRNPEIKKVARR